MRPAEAFIRPSTIKRRTGLRSIWNSRRCMTARKLQSPGTGRRRPWSPRVPSQTRSSSYSRRRVSRWKPPSSRFPRVGKTCAGRSLGRTAMSRGNIITYSIGNELRCTRSGEQDNDRCCQRADEKPKCRVIIPPVQGGWSEPAMFEWELTAESWTDEHPHSEYNFVIEGQLFVESGGVTIEAHAGDVVQVP